MHFKIIAILALLSSCFFTSQGQSSYKTRINAWQIAPCPLPTRWSKDVSPENALNEYPRPQMAREKWQNLNGLWDYSIVDSAVKWPTKFDGELLVPFPVESSLSGVKKTLLPNQRLWYKRTLKLNNKDKNKRYLLHFGAVDYIANVFVNKKNVGSHEGGYTAFSIDITNQLEKGTNELAISVWDPSDNGNNPRGKQVLRPEGIMYTSSSGIWQTVWLEEVAGTYITGLRITPDIDSGFVKLNVSTNANSTDHTVRVTVNDMARQGQVNSDFSVAMANARLWTPEDPYLYDMKVQLLYKGKVVDEVKSYFGMRKVEIKTALDGQSRIHLNNKVVFNLGVLDQGFWPDGLYTAPTDAALKWDIEAVKKMGFNTIRKHIKVEPARWYYHCDKLGMLVWQDMVFPANLSMMAKKEFEKESENIISQLHNYPSIVCWVLFNEGWNRYDQARLTEWIKKLDPSRLINGHSGENYDRDAPKDDKRKWVGSDMVDVHDYPGPGTTPKIPGKARVLGEWGGVRVATTGHQWNGEKSWGYVETTPEEFARKYEFMTKHLAVYQEEGLSGSIYTQPFDVEIEENGLITYDREIFKIPVETMRSINNLILQGK